MHTVEKVKGEDMGTWGRERASGNGEREEREDSHRK